MVSMAFPMFFYPAKENVITKYSEGVQPGDLGWNPTVAWAKARWRSQGMGFRMVKKNDVFFVFWMLIMVYE